MKAVFFSNESTLESFEEKDISPARPFEIERSPFGSECSVFFPAAWVYGQGLDRTTQRFSKVIFASEQDAKKEIANYKKSLKIKVKMAI